jgi:hypothetical protein
MVADNGNGSFTLVNHIAIEWLHHTRPEPRGRKLDKETSNVVPRRLQALVYARHGRELMGCKSPVRESCQWHLALTQVLAEGKGGTARDRLVEAGAQSDKPSLS